MTRRTLAALATALAALALPAAASAAVTTQSIDGPSADISRFSDIAMAPDGTGALVYLKKDGGKDHVFVSVRTGGTWKAGVRVDTGADMGSAPCRTDGALRAHVAAANGGRVVVTYLSGAGPANFALCSNVKKNSATSVRRRGAADQREPGRAVPGRRHERHGHRLRRLHRLQLRHPRRAAAVRPTPPGRRSAPRTPNTGGILDKTATDHSGDSGANESGPVITVTPQDQAVMAFSSAASGDPQDMIVRRLKNASGQRLGGPDPGRLRPGPGGRCGHARPGPRDQHGLRHADDLVRCRGQCLGRLPRVLLLHQAGQPGRAARHRGEADRRHDRRDPGDRRPAADRHEPAERRRVPEHLGERCRPGAPRLRAAERGPDRPAQRGPRGRPAREHLDARWPTSTRC